MQGITQTFAPGCAVTQWVLFLSNDAKLEFLCLTPQTSNLRNYLYIHHLTNSVHAVHAYVYIFRSSLRRLSKLVSDLILISWNPKEAGKTSRLVVCTAVQREQILLVPIIELTLEAEDTILILIDISGLSPTTPTLTNHNKLYIRKLN